MTTTPEQPETQPTAQNEANPKTPVLLSMEIDTEILKAILKSQKEKNPNDQNIPIEIVGDLIGRLSKTVTKTVLETWQEVLREEDERLNNLPY